MNYDYILKKLKIIYLIRLTRQFISKIERNERKKERGENLIFHQINSKRKQLLTK